MSTIVINTKTKLGDIQDWFFATFEFLKIEFYKNAHEEFQGSGKGEQLTGDYELSQFGFRSNDYPFEITQGMTVNQVEEKFKKELNLNAQVFRKSGDVWLQTMSTDEWSLQEQIERANFHNQEIM
jgi:hypothetical protein